MSITSAVKTTEKPGPEPAPLLGKAPISKAEADVVRRQEEELKAAQHAEALRQQTQLQTLVGTIYARMISSAEIMEAYNPEDQSLDKEKVAGFFNLCNLLSIEAGWAHAQQSWGFTRPGTEAATDGK